MVSNFCNDVIDAYKEPSSEQDGVSGTGEIRLEPAKNLGNLGCGSEKGATHGTLRLKGLEAEDGTRFAPIVVESNNIGCYSG